MSDQSEEIYERVFQVIMLKMKIDRVKQYTHKKKQSMVSGDHKSSSFHGNMKLIKSKQVEITMNQALSHRRDQRTTGKEGRSGKSEKDTSLKVELKLNLHIK